MREETRFFDEKGDLVLVAISGSFLRGLTGFESRGPKLPAKDVPPSRSPDSVVEEVTSPEQALIYRLSGDYNTLHADPSVAQAVGFSRPILHGLCTMGHAVRAVCKTFIPESPESLKSVSVSRSTERIP
jgi:acyl dehydratase